MSKSNRPKQDKSTPVAEVAQQEAAIEKLVSETVLDNNTPLATAQFTATPDIGGYDEDDLEEEDDDIDPVPAAPRGPLAKLVDELALTTKQATMDLEFTDPRTLPGRQIAKREAQERLEGLREQYASALKSGLAAIYVDGDNVAAFCDIAREEGPALVVDASALYRRLAEGVEKGMRADRLFEPSQFAFLLTALGDVGKELKVGSFASPKYTDGAVLATFEDVVAHVRRLVRVAVGDGLNQLFIMKSIEEQALKIHYHQSVVPVVVVGATADEKKGLKSFFNDKVVSTTIRGEVTQELVLDAFNNLKQCIHNN